MMLLAYVAFVMLHRPDGETVVINPTHVVAVTPAHDHGHFAPGVHCVIHTTDRKFLSVKETCREVQGEMRKKG